MRESVIYQQILEEGEAKGREEGREEGKEQKARQIALKMLLEGFSIGEIARLTDLSPAMLEDLQRQSHES